MDHAAIDEAADATDNAPFADAVWACPTHFWGEGGVSPPSIVSGNNNNNGVAADGATPLPTPHVTAVEETKANATASMS